MWLTGFDVPELDTIYIDKPLQKHNLIQTISRVNRKMEGKSKGLVVDYIGIKRQMNQALAMYSRIDATNFEDIQQSVIEVKIISICWRRCSMNSTAALISAASRRRSLPA